MSFFCITGTASLSIVSFAFLEWVVVDFSEDKRMLKF